MTIVGTIKNITFQNQQTSWSVITLELPDGKFMRATGIMLGIQVGKTVRLEGEMENNKYGESLKATSCIEERPSDSEGIYKYLSSGLIKNIGPVNARRIVTTFGEQTLDILDNYPERLREVHGIGPKRIESIIEAVKEQKTVRTIMIWLKQNDLSNSLAVKIYKQYGDDAMALLQENPYRLYRDIKGVGFKKADDTAIKMGMPKEHMFRIQAGIYAVLENWAANDGGTYMPYDMLVSAAAGEEYLNIDPALVSDILDKDMEVTINDDNNVMLPEYDTAETIIADRISTINRYGHRFPTGIPNFEAIYNMTKMTYSEEQQAAITAAVNKSVLVLTGGPGTGKTATMNAIIAELERRKLKVLLAAPTGRAAKRMSEVSGRESKTIHRLLEYQQGRFLRDRGNPLSANVVIVDETSMIDTILMKNLLNAVDDNTKLILIGDSDQLPPVGPGCPLRDIIASNTVPCIRLNKIFRQAQGSDIVMNAHAINRGVLPRMDNHTGTDFLFAEVPEKEDVQVRIMTAAKNILDRTEYKLDDIQVLTPMRREWDPIGCIQLNRCFQNEFNPNGAPVTRNGDTEYRTGDRIMVTKNNYDKGVFNGDIGKVVRKGNESDIDPESNHSTPPLMIGLFDGREVPFYGGELDQIDLAYACTVHKSQGSEYPVVLMPVHTSHFIMLKRNMVYTGITRAKKLFFGVGTKKAMAIAVTTEDTKVRYTLLKQRLQAARIQMDQCMMKQERERREQNKQTVETASLFTDDSGHQYGYGSPSF